MRFKELHQILLENGWKYFAIKWPAPRKEEHIFFKGNCQVRIRDLYVNVVFSQTQSNLRREGNLLGPFRDGVMLNLDSREIIR